MPLNFNEPQMRAAQHACVCVCVCVCVLYVCVLYVCVCVELCESIQRARGRKKTFYLKNTFYLKLGESIREPRNIESGGI